MSADAESADTLVLTKMKGHIERDVQDTHGDRLVELPDKTSMEGMAKLNPSEELPETSDGDGVSTEDDQRGSDEQSEALDHGTLGEDRQLYAALQRLLKCTVCYEQRPDTNQCKNGHLICRLCTTRLERNATAAAKAQCPTCRITLHPGLSRCLLAQQLASELPAPCSFCGKYFRHLELNRHECMECKMRPVKCRYNLFGCSWRGHWIDVQKHHEVCFYPRKKVHEIEPIVTEYINTKTKPVQDLKQAWKELLGSLGDKPRGMVMNLKEICLRKKLREIGSPEISLDDLCFTGSTNALVQFGSPMTSIDVSVDSDEKKVHYRIKFNGGLTPSFRFRLISFHIGGTKVEVLDHLHAPNTVPNTESQRFSCNLLLAEKQDFLLPSKRLLEKSDMDKEYASAKVDMLILYDLNRCSLRITPVEVHEWTPVCTGNTQPLCSNGVRQNSYGAQESNATLLSHQIGSDSPPTTDLQPTSLSHVPERGSLIGNNWRENLTATDPLLLDLSTRGVDNVQTSTFITPARPQEPRHEVIQQNLFNADMFATLSNNSALQEEDYEVETVSCELSSGLRDVGTARRSYARRSARMEELNSNGISHREQEQDYEPEEPSDTDVNRHNATRSRTTRRSTTPAGPTPRRQGPQQRRGRRLKLVLLHSGTQTLGSKINRRWLEPKIVRNAPPVETNMSASAEPEPKLNPTLAARLIASLQRMAPYLSRMHLASNLQVISRRPRRPGRPRGSARGIKGRSLGLRYARHLGRKRESIGRRSSAARRSIQATGRQEPPINRWFKLNTMTFTQPLVSFITSVKERGWQMMSWTRRSAAIENSGALDNSNGEVSNQGTRTDLANRLDNILAVTGSAALVPSECDSIEIAQRAFRTDPMSEIA
ncbi:unnamed protein product [Schistocephalus solidus]|uniref:Cysteine and histidine-rich protein 1 homolog n=1 Tax=Schistocephalus solidus TaxID=70667 RepID=A0A183T0K5_SCHSO|nr:unnamed protein product [Schistocephalus solidus]